MASHIYSDSCGVVTDSRQKELELLTVVIYKVTLPLVENVTFVDLKFRYENHGPIRAGFNFANCAMHSIRMELDSSQTAFDSLE